jgi:hypothetical protein
MIYIISRARPHNVQKLQKRWETMGFACTVVLDTDDPFYDEYTYLPVSVLQSRYRGVAGARATAVEHAAENGHTTIVMSDDDISPVAGSDYAGLLRVAEHDNALGVGAFVDYHSFAMKGHLDKLEIPTRAEGYSGYDRVCAVGDEGFICPSGIAFRMFAINVRNAVKLCDGSGFDTALWCQNEDGEFMRQGIAVLGLPWLLYPQAKATSIGARYVTGGVVDSLGIAHGGDGSVVAKHPDVQGIWAEVHRRWPNHVNAPNIETGIRTQWSKLLDTHVPDWRDYSALHGAEKNWRDR